MAAPCIRCRQEIRGQRPRWHGRLCAECSRQIFPPHVHAFFHVQAWALIALVAFGVCGIPILVTVFGS